jgi:hypothetical protein
LVPRTQSSGAQGSSFDVSSKSAFDQRKILDQIVVSYDLLDFPSFLSMIHICVIITFFFRRARKELIEITPNEALDFDEELAQERLELYSYLLFLSTCPLPPPPAFIVLIIFYSSCPYM